MLVKYDSKYFSFWGYLNFFCTDANVSVFCVCSVMRMCDANVSVFCFLCVPWRLLHRINFSQHLSFKALTLLTDWYNTNGPSTSHLSENIGWETAILKGGWNLSFAFFMRESFRSRIGFILLTEILLPLRIYFISAERKWRYHSNFTLKGTYRYLPIDWSPVENQGSFFKSYLVTKEAAFS